MALFEVIVRQRYLGRDCLNRWYYNAAGVPAAVQLSFALASAFGGILALLSDEFPEDTVMWDIQQFQHTEAIFVELQVKALFDVTDFYTVPYSSAIHGIQSGTPMSSFNAYPFRTNRVRTDIRRGSKRFVGVSEQYAAAGGAVESSLIPQMDVTAEHMSDNLVYDDEGNTLTFTPCVLSLQKHAPDADHDTDWYSYYSTDAVQLTHAAVGVVWSFVPNITTQNSRKR